MPSRALHILVLAAGAASACAATARGRQPSPSPLMILAGACMLADGGSKDLTDDYGYRGTLAMLAYESGIAGLPWIDFDWNRVTGQGNRVDAAGVLYTERIPLSQSVYLGVGLGSFYNNVRIVQADGSTLRDDKWTIGGKALIGISLGSTVVIEGGYYYSGEIAGIDTKAYGLSLGLRF